MLIVDDSATTRLLLTSVLEADPEITVVGRASSGPEALDLTAALRPSVVVMDIDTPELDGLETTRRIMIEHPTPIIVITANDDTRAVELGLQAVKAGAVTLAAKPRGPKVPGSAEEAKRLVMLVKAMGDLKVVRQTGRIGVQRPVAHRPPRPRHVEVAVVGVAASTGGPAALLQFLTTLPSTIGVPILVVQHISSGFVQGLASWLGTKSRLPVSVARDGEELVGGTILLAPDDRHLEVTREHVRLTDSPRIGGFRPSADALFASLATSFGASAAVVVLTGMGVDGLAGARQVADAGGTVLAQDAESSIVSGMPEAVTSAGVATFTGRVEELALRIAEMAPRKV